MIKKFLIENGFFARVGINTKELQGLKRNLKILL
jgi:hypothetical protein